MFPRFLIHPLARGQDIDAPEATLRRRAIVADKVFLRRIYEEWYEKIAAELPAGEGGVLEIGSGAGFLGRRVPGLISSDVLAVPGITALLDACQLPFAASSLKAIVATDVLHHINRPRLFFAEAARCVRPGGAVVMIEPWNTTWSGWVYTHLHHEPFVPDAEEWEFPSSGPLSGANGALPWILFSRDRSRFERECPGWRIDTVRPMMPFRYLLSGGLSYRSFMPGWSFPVWRWVEDRLDPWAHLLAMFALVVLRRGREPVQ